MCEARVPNSALRLTRPGNLFPPLTAISGRLVVIPRLVSVFVRPLTSAMAVFDPAPPVVTPGCNGDFAMLSCKNRSPLTLAVLGMAFARLLCSCSRGPADDPLEEDGHALPAGAVMLGPQGLDFKGSVGPWAMFDEDRKIALGNGRRIRIFDAATHKEIRSW